MSSNQKFYKLNTNADCAEQTIYDSDESEYESEAGEDTTPPQSEATMSTASEDSMPLERIGEEAEPPTVDSLYNLSAQLEVVPVCLVGTETAAINYS